jgi:hypothetical protein
MKASVGLPQLAASFASTADSPMRWRRSTATMTACRGRRISGTYSSISRSSFSKSAISSLIRRAVSGSVAICRASLRYLRIFISSSTRSFFDRTAGIPSIFFIRRRNGQFVQRTELIGAIVVPATKASRSYGITCLVAGSSCGERPSGVQVLARIAGPLTWPSELRCSLQTCGERIGDAA